MRDIVDELRSPGDEPLSEVAAEHVVRMNMLYRNQLITYNEMCIGLGGKSVGVAGDRFAPATPPSDRPQFQ